MMIEGFVGFFFCSLFVLFLNSFSSVVPEMLYLLCFWYIIFCLVCLALGFSMIILMFVIGWIISSIK